ncbi:MAG TPA: hypothetical protein VM010_05435, partial [Chitinophagaceae bacterium]|nr:hypothetical protein [Chitinophagaceae bacterium]
NSPVKDVFRITIPLATEDSAGRMSWDETAVLVAVKGVAPYYKLARGRVVVAPDGRNTWKAGAGPHGYLIPVTHPHLVQARINALMMHQPAQ